jgi:hypothetical protein
MLHLADSSLCSLLESGEFIPVLAIGGGLFVAIVAIVMTSIRGMVVGRAREMTKRELAAYVAEGTMDADKAVELANAGKSRSCCG